MIEEPEARSRILAALSPLEPISLPLREAYGHHAAELLRATVALPGSDNSSMDGYALHAADCGKTDISLPVVGEQPAGVDLGWTVTPGTAIRIFTGAPLPADTAAVIMQEDVERLANTITIREAALPGEFIRRAGADLCPGQMLWPVGEILSPARLSLAASQGLATVSVTRRPRVGILTTGSELRPAGAVLAPGQLYNSNETLLAAQVQAAFPGGGLEIITHTVADDLEATREALLSLSLVCDVLLVAGGVSVGDHDLVKPALQSLGAHLDFWRVKIKPGKPFLFGKLGSTFLFGLPGNPVSGFVTTFALVLPALRRLAGCPESTCHPSPVPVILATGMDNRDQRPTYFRGRYDASTRCFTPGGLQESHALAGLANANMLVRLEPGIYPPGALVDGWQI